MLNELTIENIGVVPHASLELSPGLNVLTGETGAGKTIVLTALGLVLGGKSDTGLIRKDAESLSVETVWSVDDRVAGLVENVDGVVEDGNLIVSKSVNISGKSKLVCGGRSVPNSVMVGLSSHLVSIHGQSDQLKLKDVKQQLAVLDGFVGEKLEQVFGAYSEKYGEWLRLSKELKKRVADNAAVEAEKFYTEMVCKDFDTYVPVEGEEEELLSIIGRLTHVEDIYKNLVGVLTAANPDESVTGGVADQLNTMLSGVVEAAQYDKGLSDVAKMLEEIIITFDDTVNTVQQYVDGVDLDVLNDLNTAHARLNDLRMLVKKYVPNGSVDDLVVFMWEHKNKQGVSFVSVDELESQVESARLAALTAAEKLTEVRREGVERLTREVNVELEALNMKGTMLHIEHSVGDVLTAHGVDVIEFMVKTGSMVSPKPISKAASGGELSRIMLALEVVLADPEHVSTFVFDEVDSGVGGATAVEVGKRLAKLAKECQVVVVTHLPQVAVFADSHFKVLKNVDDDGGVSSTVSLLSSDESKQELTRMMSGLEGSATGLSHVEELLTMVDGFKKSL
jgi:DNA repair protein RecN (Recombination protein N)